MITPTSTPASRIQHQLDTYPALVAARETLIHEYEYSQKMAVETPGILAAYAALALARKEGV